VETRIRKRKTRSDKIEFTDKDINQIEVMAAMGLTNKQLSAWFSMSEDTFYRRLDEKNINLSAALTRGRSKVQFELANKAYELAIAGNTSMLKYVLGCRFNWSDASHISISTSQEESIETDRKAERANLINAMTRDELKTCEELWGAVADFEDKVKERIERDKAQKHLV
jgi:hypothetical protein